MTEQVTKKDILDALSAAYLARKGEWGALAEAAGVPRSTIAKLARYETHGRTNPTLDTVVNMANAVGLRILILAPLSFPNPKWKRTRSAVEPKAELSEVESEVIGG